MSNDPSVSVIIPTYNRSDILTQSIDSVLEQTYTDFELIVVDDASTDDTREVVATYDDERLTYVRHETNRHVSAARNTGIEHASGDFVAFLDDDDEWVPAKLAKQVSLLQDCPSSVGMVYCWLDYLDGEEVVNEYRPTLSGDIFQHTLAAQPIGNASTLLVRREVIEDIGGFDESLPRGNDGDFIRRVTRKYEVDYVPEVLVRYHVGHDYQRITREDEAGIRNAIKGKRTKLQKFDQELDQYPREHARVLVSLARQHWRVGEWGAGLSCLSRAITIAPLTADIYLDTARFFKNDLVRYHLS